MNENPYIYSDTKLTATWETSRFGSSYTCSNCKHTEDHGYPARGIQLGSFCPNCGFRMANPRFVKVEFDYD